MKRTGDGYPGNEEAYPGTLTQEVLRALIDRTKYVDRQIPHSCNKEAIRSFRHVLAIFEDRAAYRHGKTFVFDGTDPIESYVPDTNGHLTQFWADL